jgi:hypothetical protein
MKQQAKRVLEKCGGAPRVAEWLGIDPSRPYRWTYPRSRGGSGGVIPARHHDELLRKAREFGVDLSPSDFFESPTESAE